MIHLRPSAVRTGFGATRPSGASARFTAAGVSAAAVVVLALVAGLWLRLDRLDLRPMHNDEANQAIKFGELLEHGEYAYDAFDHHGPTLYYLTLPVAWLRGQATLASLDEWTLRAVPVAFGAATILLAALLPTSLGRTAGPAAALLTAISPAMVFYSRMYIQEAMFACFALAFVLALGRALTSAGPRWPVLAGAAAGLTVATKETWVLVLPAALAACGVAWWSLGPARRVAAPGAADWRRACLLAAGIALPIAVLFYSSALAHPGAILDPFRAAPTYVQRGVDPTAHVQPWHYYVGLLAWSSSGGLWWTEAPVLILAAVGAVAAWSRPDPHRPEAAFWRRYVAAYALVTLAVYSAIPYKTPWNLVPFYAAVLATAGIGVAVLASAARARTVQVALGALLALAGTLLSRQAVRAAVDYAADARNPYVYAQTVPDAVRMASRIRALAALHPDGLRMLVMVVAPPHEQWPLPWYLRTMPNVGYWTDARELPVIEAPVVVASMENADRLDAILGERYVSELRGVRPDVLVALYVERGLWDRFLAGAALGGT
jgi:uncharacterized protein (TIGR03663 family)